MEFGKLNDLSQLDLISWDLPTNDPRNQLNWSKPKNLEDVSRPHQVWMGAPAWGHPEWVGKVYPPKTKSTHFLYHYSRYFNTIELNTTHYRIPTLEQTQKWKSQVPETFRFCPKIYKGISHDPSGLSDKDLLQSWFASIEAFETSCGPCFLQLPPHFDYDHKALLFQFLKSWSDEFPLAIEFRDSSWFQNGHILPALVDYLSQRNIGLVMTDVAGRRDVLHSSVSSSFCMVRFIGNGLHPSDFERARIWNERLLEWQKLGLSETYFFVHQPDDLKAPDMAEYLKSLPYFQHLKNAALPLGSEEDPSSDDSQFRFEGT